MSTPHYTIAATLTLSLDVQLTLDGGSAPLVEAAARRILESQIRAIDLRLRGRAEMTLRDGRADVTITKIIAQSPEEEEMELLKPPDCTCAFPKAFARNMCGHAVHCPVYQRWAEIPTGTPEHILTPANLARARDHLAFLRQVGDLLYPAEHQAAARARMAEALRTLEVWFAAVEAKCSDTSCQEPPKSGEKPEVPSTTVAERPGVPYD